MKKILLFGTFDGVHAGHKNLFKQARALADEVYVVVARDATVEKVKNRTPNNDEDVRLRDVLAQDAVDHARLGVTGGDKYAVIGEIAPDVILLGYDQEVFTNGIEAAIDRFELETKIVRGEAYSPEKYKSSILNITLKNDLTES